MSFSSTSEKERVIDEVARRIVDLGMEDLAITILEGYQPAMGIMGPMSYITLFPLIEGLSFKWPEIHELGDLIAGDPIGTTQAIIDKVREKTKGGLGGEKRKKDSSIFGFITHLIRSIFQG